jgi:hypothetical protein
MNPQAWAACQFGVKSGSDLCISVLSVRLGSGTDILRTRADARLLRCPPEAEGDNKRTFKEQRGYWTDLPITHEH